MRRHLTAAFAALTLVVAPAAVRADGESTADGDIGFRGWGPRLGLTFNPDQFHVGAHMDFGNFARHVRFQPNLEIGFGDHFTLITANADAAYRFSDRWDVWTPYLGGGIGLVSARASDDGLSDTSNNLGVSILGGIDRGLSSGDRFFLEAKLGLTDHTPDLMLTAGWTFYH
jgi:opacity protein-like surface antigen